MSYDLITSRPGLPGFCTIRIKVVRQPSKLDERDQYPHGASDTVFSRICSFLPILQEEKRSAHHRLMSGFWICPRRFVCDSDCLVGGHLY